jgi:uncharacterized protein (DUF433 family)
MIAHPHVEMLEDGTPVIENTKIRVVRLYLWWANRNLSVDSLMSRYPMLSKAEILSALAFAFDNMDLMKPEIAKESMR